MSYYRQFSLEELAGMEDEFVNYLVVNGIAPEDWASIKTNEKEKADGILLSFSQVVWQSILSKAQYLDLYESQVILAFYCGPKEIEMRGIQTADSSYDFTQSASIERAKSQPPKDLSTLHSKKTYVEVREHEIYQLMLRGAQPSDGKLFHSLS